MTSRADTLKNINKDGPLWNGTPCWIPRYKPTKSGYVHVIVEGRHWRMHRLTYEEYVGPIPQGLELDHLCRRKECCNPKHLESVTHAENIKRSPTSPTNKGVANRSHCKRGHEMSGDNVLFRPTGARRCRQCRDIQREKDRIKNKKERIRKSDFLTRCKNGHEMTEDNTYHHPPGAYRECRQCRREAGRKRAARALREELVKPEGEGA